ncbi:hypothetical protein CDL12_15488 [Handroanthus impetiginosus]|uniref:F-box domain-containing protein n=1 Tax=Handroanthus impetiginosus TaxID=429701 RepID=A0A2G9H2Z6_9LAMI|nr:hypothetical protein CDL12_15488 [Handroanthus impetiginosus]
MSLNQENTSIPESSFDEISPDAVPKNLPSDIIFEILTRTSLETLDACKSVCNEWNHLICESSFMPLYCKRTNTLFGYFIQDMIRNKFVSMFVSTGQNSSIKNIHSDMKILASSDHGILCCLRINGKSFRYYVCKPVTEQWQALPNPKLRYQTAAIAMMVMKARPLRYKIVRLSKEGQTRSEDIYRCEIFDSETWTWTMLQHINLPDSETINSKTSLSTSNSVHWLTSEDNVLQFHKAEQSFQKFPLPKSVQGNRSYPYKQLVQYEGRLGLTYLTQESNMELWVMQKDQWMKKMVLNIQTFNEVIFYNLEDYSFTRVQLDHRLTTGEEVFQFRSDFEPVDLGRSS